jgi:hypothetical protein
MVLVLVGLGAVCRVVFFAVFVMVVGIMLVTILVQTILDTYFYDFGQ